MIAEVFLRTGLLPSAVWALPDGERAFVFAAVRFQVEREVRR